MEGINSVKVLSFDVYGTLIDWERGIAAALRPWASRHGLLISDEALVTAFARHETLVQTEHPGWLYPNILAEVMWRIGNDLDASVNDVEASAFGRSVGQWPAFEDSAEALRRLQQHFKLIVLSNVDDVSFQLSNDRLGVDFDLVLTAQQIGSYKPAAANFERLDEGVATMGFGTDELLHVAESLYHDHEPAKDHGLTTVWIHRRHAKDGYGATAVPLGDVTPDFRFESMKAFADELCGLRAFDDPAATTPA